MNKEKFFIGIVILFSAAAMTPAMARPYSPDPWVDPVFIWGPPEPILMFPEPPPRVIYMAPPQPRRWVEKSPSNRYYCPDPAGYYPLVGRCPRGWVKVISGESGQ